MNLEEIVFRDKNKIVSQKEMEFVVKEYIFERKQKAIDINILNGLNRNSIMFAFKVKDELDKLTSLHAHACQWLKENKYKNK